MKIKTLICSCFLSLAIGCSSSNSGNSGNLSIDNSLPLPNYQTELTACKASSCSSSAKEQCLNLLALLQTPNSGANGMTQACGEAQAAVLITCSLTPPCFSGSSQEQLCASGYLSQITTLCTPPLPSVQQAFATCKATQCSGQTSAQVTASCNSLAGQQASASQACNDLTNAAALICYSYSNSTGPNCNNTAAAANCLTQYQTYNEQIIAACG